GDVRGSDLRTCVWSCELMRRGEYGKRLPQDSFDRGLSSVGFCPKRVERRARLAFAKAERTERVEGLFVSCRRARIDDSAGRRAVRGAKHQIAGRVSLDHELTTVQCAVMRSANRDEVVHAVLAAFRAKRNVM